MTPHAIVVMGVSGSGKSTLGLAIAERLGRSFIEGDALHPAANVAKMASAIPLDDADRMPWLIAVGKALGGASAPGAVASCSALKRSYRDILRELVGGELLFVHPLVNHAALAVRLAGRGDHFMPPTLLASQLAILEPLASDELAIELDASRPVEAQVNACLASLASARTATPPMD